MSRNLTIRLAALSALLVGALALAAGPSQAIKPKIRYVFRLAHFELAEGIPPAVADQVRAALVKEIGEHSEIVTTLPEGAPDPKTEPKKFKRYIDKRKLRAFDVRVEVVGYERALEAMPEGRSGQRLKVSIQLRMFGETIPDRSMAFAGGGSATVKIDIGKKVRDRDDEVAHEEAFGIACGDAVEESLVKLKAPPPSQQNKQQKKKKKRRKSKAKH